MRMLESGEMYLETILILSKNSGSMPRSVDVAEHMGFSKPAVSRAMGRLKESRHILIDGDGFISLTDIGKQIAEKMYERHTFLTNVIMSLGVDEATAITDACKIEHDISEKTFNAIKAHFSE